MYTYRVRILPRTSDDEAMLKKKKGIKKKGS